MFTLILMAGFIYFASCLAVRAFRVTHGVEINAPKPTLIFHSILTEGFPFNIRKEINQYNATLRGEVLAASHRDKGYKVELVLNELEPALNMELAKDHPRLPDMQTLILRAYSTNPKVSGLEYVDPKLISKTREVCDSIILAYIDRSGWAKNTALTPNDILRNIRDDLVQYITVNKKV